MRRMEGDGRNSFSDSKRNKYFLVWESREGLTNVYTQTRICVLERKPCALPLGVGSSGEW